MLLSAHLRVKTYQSNKNLKLTHTEIHSDLDRQTYWGRIHFENDDGSQKTKVLFSASFEFIWDFSNALTIEGVKLDEWNKELIQKWRETGDSIFAKPIHYDVYANTEEGMRKGLEFLNNETAS